MALTFPLALDELADLLPMEAWTWQIEDLREHSMLGTGETLSADLGPRLLRGDVSCRPLPNTEARRLFALLLAASDAGGSFYLYSPLAAYPKADPGGTILGASTVTVLSVGSDNKSLAFEGLPGGFVLTGGDLVAVDYGTPARRALLQLLAGSSADGAGETAEIEVRPHLRPGIAPGDDVYLKKPAAKVKIIPGSLVLEPVGTNRARIRFSVRQTLQAG